MSVNCYYRHIQLLDVETGKCRAELTGASTYIVFSDCIELPSPSFYSHKLYVNYPRGEINEIVDNRLISSKYGSRNVKIWKF